MDLFGENFTMKLDEGRDKYYSFMGALLSFIFLVILTVFIFSKFQAWKEKQDVDVMGATIEDAFHFTDKFSAEDGLFVAAALTGFNSDTEILEDPKYGKLKVIHFGWGNTDGLLSTPEPIENHFCSLEELGITPGEKTKIYPIYKSSQKEVHTYRKKFKCINSQDMVIWGDFNS